MGYILHTSIEQSHNIPISLFSNFFAVRPTASESICRCKGTSEGCDSAPLVSCSEGISTNLTFSRNLYKALFALS